MCCKRLAGNTGCKNDAKNRHLSTIAQLCRAISSRLRHVSTIGKKLVKQQYLLQMSLRYSELRPTNGWDRLVGLGHPIIFQPVSRLGRVTVRQSSSGRQPNFAALNRGRHLCSAGRPSRWALAHILVVFILFLSCIVDCSYWPFSTSTSMRWFLVFFYCFWRIFYGPDAVPVTQTTLSEHCRKLTEHWDQPANIFHCRHPVFICHCTLAEGALLPICQLCDVSTCVCWYNVAIID